VSVVCLATGILHFRCSRRLPRWYPVSHAPLDVVGLCLPAIVIIAVYVQDLLPLHTQDAVEQVSAIVSRAWTWCPTQRGHIPSSLLNKLACADLQSRLLHTGSKNNDIVLRRNLIHICGRKRMLWRYFAMMNVSILGRSVGDVPAPDSVPAKQGCRGSI